MSDRLTDPVAYGKRVGIRLEPVTRIPSTKLRGVALARNNGRVAAECSVPLPGANPYRKGSKKHAAFLDGYRWVSPTPSVGEQKL